MNMNKTIVICAGMCLALTFTGCKSKESAYKKAYEKAQAQEAQNPQPVQTETPVVAPLVEKPATQTTVVDNTDNVSVRSEDVNLVSGRGLSNYSVVVGSFGLRANADGLQNKLKAAGYEAQIVLNPVRNLYRVVASTHATKDEAVRSRNQLRSTYADAWLLYKQ